MSQHSLNSCVWRQSGKWMSGITMLCLVMVSERRVDFVFVLASNKRISEFSQWTTNISNVLHSRRIKWSGMKKRVDLLETMWIATNSIFGGVLICICRADKKRAQNWFRPKSASVRFCSKSQCEFDYGIVIILWKWIFCT